MKEKTDRITNIVKENRAIKNCTTSSPLFRNKDSCISVFSLAENTEISKECYDYHKLWIMYEGKAVAICDNAAYKRMLSTGNSYLTPKNIPIGIESDIGCIYVEIELEKEINMNRVLKAGEVLELKNLIPYQDGKIVNMDIFNTPKMKYVLMSFDKGTGLSEHAAPGEALVFALDGEGVIGYEGKEYKLKAGETFKFDKFGKHSVTANEKFKMALLLMLD